MSAFPIGAPDLQIGNLAIVGRAILAPMSGITDIAFRKTAHSFGAPLVVSEMVASDEFAKGSQEARLRAEGADFSPHMVQLAGCEAHWMAEAARIAVANGANIIDINMGCPAKRVTGGYAGSALMRDIDHAFRLIEATVNAVNVPVTLKMRLGWDEQSRNAAELAVRAEALGIKMITVHGRTRQQFYKGKADWAALAPVRKAITIPLVANGDIGSVLDARAALEASGADAVMIGRAALGQPWLIGDIAHELAGASPRFHDPMELQTAIIAHYQGILSIMGREAGLRHARKHLAAYAESAERRGCLDARRLKAELVTSQSPERVIALLTTLFPVAYRSAA